MFRECFRNVSEVFRRAFWEYLGSVSAMFREGFGSVNASGLLLLLPPVVPFRRQETLIFERVGKVWLGRIMLVTRPSRRGTWGTCRSPRNDQKAVEIAEGAHYDEKPAGIACRIQASSLSYAVAAAHSAASAAAENPRNDQKAFEIAGGPQRRLL